MNEIYDIDDLLKGTHKNKKNSKTKSQNKNTNKKTNKKTEKYDPNESYQKLALDSLNQSIEMSNIQQINYFNFSTNRVWTSMYDMHASKINQLLQTDIISKKIKLTRYIDYVEIIRDSKIKTPDWFILTPGSSQQKIIPCYDGQIDFLSFALVSNLFPGTKDKKFMAMFHQSTGMIRNGMHLTDVTTRNIFKIFGNISLLNYIRAYSTSPERIFLIKDHLMSYYEHVKYGLLHEELERMFLISPRQIIMITKILFDMKSILVDEINLLNPSRAKTIKKILEHSRKTNLFKKLWPNLKFIVLMKDGRHKICYHYISKIITGIKTYCPIYWIPETTIGYDIDNSGNYVIDPRKGYFEFIKLTNPLITENMKGIRELEIGQYYNLVVSTISSGVVKYITGEIVRVTGYFNGSPKINVVCHESDLIKCNATASVVPLGFTRETPKLAPPKKAVPPTNDKEIEEIKIITPNQIEFILMKKNNLTIVDYCYKCANGNDITLYIELDDSHYVKDIDERFIDIKENLKKNNIGSTLKDKLNVKFDIKFIRPGTFEILYKLRYSDEIDPAMVQIPRLITDEYDLEVLRGGILFVCQ